MNYILIFKIGWWFQKKPLNSPSCDKNSDKQESMSTIKNLQLTSNSVMKTLGLGTRQGAPSHHSYFKRPARALRQEKEKKRTHVWEKQNRSCLQMAVSAHLADPPKLLMTDCTVWVRDSKAFTLFCSGSNSWTVRIRANRCPSSYRTWQTQQCPLLPPLLPSPSFSHLKGLWQTCKRCKSPEAVFPNSTCSLASLCHFSVTGTFVTVAVISDHWRHYLKTIMTHWTVKVMVSILF